jgi:phosphoribosylformylglycinamidine cyclo-ligase
VADSLIEISKAFGIDAQVIGRVVSMDGKQVTVRSEVGEFIYQ